MSATSLRESRALHRGFLAVAIVLALAVAATLAWRAWQAYEMRSDLAVVGPERVLRIYLRARAGGYYGVAEDALLSRTRRQLDAPNAVSDYSDLLMHDLRIEGPYYAKRSDDPRAVQYIVRYTSRWRSSIGEPPGERTYFAYVTRLPGEERWYVAGLGTGP